MRRRRAEPISMTVMPKKGLDTDAFLLIPKALRATFVGPGPRGWDPGVFEIHHNVGCTINLGIFPAGPSLMRAGW
jgi:hypothetical protein